jgi:hypothetical protein
MCGSSSPKTVQPPPSAPPTTFDYNSANRGDGSKYRPDPGGELTKSGHSFGSELGSPAAINTGGQ